MQMFVRSSVCLSVCPMKSLKIFIFLSRLVQGQSQISLRSVSGQSQVSLRSVSGQSQVSHRSVPGQSQVSLRSPKGLSFFLLHRTDAA